MHSSGEQALLDHVRQHEGNAEVICIVPPHDAPRGPARRVFVLQDADRDFVDHLSAHASHSRGHSRPPVPALAALPSADRGGVDIQRHAADISYATAKASPIARERVQGQADGRCWAGGPPSGRPRVAAWSRNCGVGLAAMHRRRGDLVESTLRARHTAT